jgi:signal transduction histidine kinase
MEMRKLPDLAGRLLVIWLACAAEVAAAIAGLVWNEPLLAALAAAGACLAASLALSCQPRRLGLAFCLLVAAHVAVLAGLHWHFDAADRPHQLLVSHAAMTLSVVCLAWASVSGVLTADWSRPLSLFTNSATPDEQLRTTYETQIRAAAAAEERQKLARDLHDSIKQQIFVTQTSAATAQARFDSDPAGAREAIEAVRQAAREATAEMEALLDQLRAAPVTMAGLADAVRKQCEALAFRSGATVDFEPGELPDDGLLPPGAAQALYRIAQEALSNAGRHARATHVRVELAQIGHKVVLRIHDNGAGFDPNAAPRGMGLANLRARADEILGTLELRSRPGKGTSVNVELPCPEPEAGTSAWREACVGLISALVILAASIGQYARGNSQWLALGGIGLVQSIRYAVEIARLRRLGAR